MKKLPLSVAIITKNEEENLQKLLPLIDKFAQQIVIIDSFSTDKTKDIALKFTKDFYQIEWKGFAEQKNLTLQYCNQEWILCLDADEIPDKELIHNIGSVINQNLINAYKLKRYTFYLGKLMKYSWQPDEQLRLFHSKLNGKWVGDYVHERLVVNGNIKTLNGKLIHYSYKSIENHFLKTINYAKLGAEKLLSNQKKVTLINLFLNPIIAFLNMYIFKFGCLDGWRGFIAAFSSMFGTFLKYSFYFEKKQIN